MAGGDISVDVSEWVKWAARLEDDAPHLIEVHMRNAMAGSLDLIEEWIAENTPVNTGALRGSFAQQIYGQAFDMRGEVATSLLYGEPVEEGRKAGKMPPVGPIKLWAKRKLGLSGKELDRAAWGIAYAIGAHGTKNAAHMVDQAYQRASRPGSEIERVWEYELERFIKDISR